MQKPEDPKKNLYAESKFMLPPDPLKLPPPFVGSLNKKQDPSDKSI